MLARDCRGTTLVFKGVFVALGSLIMPKEMDKEDETLLWGVHCIYCKGGCVKVSIKTFTVCDFTEKPEKFLVMFKQQPMLGMQSIKQKKSM